MKSNDSKAIVVHIGALRGYAIPAALQRAGRLEAFYTDMCAGRGVGKLARYVTWLPMLGPRIQRLAMRSPPHEVVAKTKTFDLAALWGLLLEAIASEREQLVQARRKHWALSGHFMCREGVGQATHLVSVFGQGHRFLEHAKKQGLTVICDVNIALSSGRIVEEEQRRYSHWEQQFSDLGDPGFRDIMLSESDLFLCPSEFVRDDLIDHHGVAASRTRLVPYAVHDRWFALETRPEPGRILFVGMVGLRKGAHYFAKSAQLLADRGHDYTFRVAGNAPLTFRNQPESSLLDFLGHVPPSSIRSELLQADILVLPSLAEGSAGVTYEALGAGVPVVTTFEAGSVVRDEIDGRIVQSRDPIALADAIEEIVENRRRRQQMSKAARARAAEFTWGHFQQRLISAIFEN